MRGMRPRLYDAHNHLQDDRFGGRQEELLAACRATGVVRMVVNGTCETDWPRVLALAKRHPEVVPSFGWHPWFLSRRTSTWRQQLIGWLEQAPQAAVGEIGLDRWKPDLPYAGQEEVFIAQLQIAAARNLPVSIHCLRAWGRLLEILAAERRPACGFLLHSYGGPVELLPRLTGLGAYFSLSGYFLHERKKNHWNTFQQVPADRLLIESDAPDQPLPAGAGRECAEAAGGRPLNHPANLHHVYAFAAQLRGVTLAELSQQVEKNFLRLFGS